MKKGIIITAVVLIAVGILIFVVGLLAGKGLQPITQEAKSYQVNEPFTEIRIDTDEADIELLPSSDGTCSVAGVETEKFYYRVSVENGVLTVTSVDERTWVDRLMMHADQPLQIHLPQTAYRSIEIDSHTGDVKVPNGFAFESVKITASTGDVECGASASNAIVITTSTGDVSLKNVTAQSTALSVSTGSVTVDDCKIDDDVTLKVGTGRSELNNLLCKNFRSEGTTGRITLKDVLAENELFIKRSTADVRFDACDAQTITVKTGTGDVTGTLRSEKVFAVSASTGKVRVPNGTSGGRCEITVSTGDVEIEILDDQNP